MNGEMPLSVLRAKTDALIERLSQGHRGARGSPRNRDCICLKGMAMVLGTLQQAVVRPKPAPVMALVLTLSWLAQPAAAFTDKDARELFGILDPEHNGKVTLVDFQINKVQAFFWRSRDERGDIKPLAFKDTILSREFFDKADFGHKGYLDGLDIVYAIRFDDIDTKRRGYFEHADLVTYLHKIGR
jgi:hypothetical protein